MLIMTIEGKRRICQRKRRRKETLQKVLTISSTRLLVIIDATGRYILRGEDRQSELCPGKALDS